MKIMNRPKEKDLFSVTSGRIQKSKNAEKKKKFNEKKKAKEDVVKEIKADLEPLSYSNITESQNILGCILEIHKYEMIVSLPNRVQGHIPITNISKSYTQLLLKVSNGEDVSEPIHRLEDLYSIGHLIIVNVKSIQTLAKEKLKIILSILPEDVNSELRPSVLSKGTIVQGAVKNTEENGFVIDTGIKNLRSAFMPLDFAPEGVCGVGSVFLCGVKRVLEKDAESSATRIKVTAKPSWILKTASLLTNRSNLVTIRPGTVVEVIIEKIYENHLELKTPWNSQAIVTGEHLTTPNTATKKFREGEEVQARVLYVTNFTNILYCSLNEKILEGSISSSSSSSHMKIGDIVENAKVFRSNKKGVHLLLPNQCSGFCSANKLQDKALTEKEIADLFPVDSRKTCRVIHVNLMDQIYVVSLQKSILSEKVFGRQNLSVGEKFRVKVIEHTDHGASVALSQMVKGFVPKIHLTDTNMKNPELKCPVGKDFSARILRHTPGEEPHLTFKSELVKSTSPLVTNFEESNMGVVTVGCIVKVYPGGLLVEFYGGSKAFIPCSKIPLKLDGGLAKVFNEGSVIKCKIVGVDTPNNKMVASMNFDGVEGKMSLNSVVSCKVYSMEEEKLVVMIEGDDTLASIPKYHLADDVALANLVFSLLKVGDVIKEAVVFAKYKNAFVLSAKASILQFVKIDNLMEKKVFKRGDVFPSVIQEIKANEITVAPIVKNFGLKQTIRKSDIFSEAKFAELSQTGLQVGQTLFVKCMKLLGRKPILSSSLQDVIRNKERTSLQLLYNSVSLENQIRLAFNHLEENAFEGVQIGKKYLSKVLALTKVGALVNIPSLGLDGVVPAKHYDEGVEPVINNTIKVRVLRINYKEQCLELTGRRNIKKLSCAKEHSIELGLESTCEVLLAKKEYIVGRLIECEGQIIYLPAKRHINDHKGRSSLYEIGSKYLVRIKFIQDNIILANLLDHCTNDNEAINIDTDVPKLNINATIPLLSLTSTLTLNPDSYTQHDFVTRAREKIQKVTQYLELKRKASKNPPPKLDTLKEDKFSEFDNEYYWNKVLRTREEKKNLKKKTGGTKNKKRKLENGGSPSKKRAKPTKPKKKKVKGESESTEPKEDDISENETEDSEDENDADADVEMETDGKMSCLEVQTNGFDWSGQALEADKDADEEDSSEDEMDKEQKTIKTLSRFERKLKSKIEEGKIRELELQRLDLNRKAETALEFEEKVESNNNKSSAVWIEYVGFYLENAQTEKARGVAERALKLIPAKMEAERLNIWNVLLQLEVMFGSQDTLQKAFKEALTTNDELKIYNIMINIYASANKIKDGEEIIKMMTKKYSQDLEVWIRAGLFYFKAKEVKSARSLLDKSLLSLPKTEHVSIINRFAQFEMKYGEAERGKTIFEKLLSNFPKRLDIWNVYADLLVKIEDIAGARTVFERMMSLKLKMKAMRTIFKRVLEFEKEFGSASKVEAVKKRVEDYVAAALKED